MTLLSQQHSGLTGGGNESLPRFSSFLRSHSGLHRLHHGSDGLSTFRRSQRNVGAKVFPGLNNMANAEGMPFALNHDGSVEPAQMLGHTHTPYATAASNCGAGRESSGGGMIFDRMSISPSRGSDG